MSISDEIKSRITMADIFSAYGFEPDRGGFIRCPFHSEKTPSLSVYDHGKKWKCFGCNEQGDVISFVMKLYGINFGQAVLRINEDFGLGLCNGRPDRRKVSEIAKKKAQEQADKRALMNTLNELSAYRRFLWHIFLTQKPKSIDDQPSKDFIFALKELDYLDYYIFDLMGERR